MSPPTAEVAAIRPDAWLATVLGHPVYAVDAASDLQVGDGPGLWYAKVDVADTATVRALEDEGFRVVDVNVTLRHDGTPVVAESHVAVGPAQPDELDALVDIAGRCFRFSRFHLDPGVSDEAANRIKREWVRSYAEGTRGIELLAARDGGRAIGFLAVLDRGDARVIDLVGVDPEAQGRGAGAALVAAFVERHRGNADELLVGTQLANAPSLRLYAHQGFGFAVAAYVLHRHGTSS